LSDGVEEIGLSDDRPNRYGSADNFGLEKAV